MEPQRLIDVPPDANGPQSNEARGKWRRWATAGALVACVVVLVAIALPTYSCGCSPRRFDKAAQSSLRGAYFAAVEVSRARGAGFSAVSNESLAAAEPALEFISTQSEGPTQVSWIVSDIVSSDGTTTYQDASWSGAVLQGEGETCWYLKAVIPPKVDSEHRMTYGQGDKDHCTGSDAEIAATADAW